MSSFVQIKPEEFTGNLFQMIGNDWMLVTAANGETVNPMTASWGGAGILWMKPVAFTFIRPQRYTHQLMDNAEGYTLSFYDESFREQLKLCGSKSGRDIDKVKECGFHVVRDGELAYFEEAHTVIFCRKMSKQHMDPATFIDNSIDTAYYPQKDYHDIYVSEITKVLVRK